MVVIFEKPKHYILELRHKVETRIETSITVVGHLHAPELSGCLLKIQMMVPF